MEGNLSFTKNWKINSKNAIKNPKRWQEEKFLEFPNSRESNLRKIKPILLFALEDADLSLASDS
jgi:hypothetical protein